MGKLENSDFKKSSVKGGHGVDDNQSTYNTDRRQRLDYNASAHLTSNPVAPDADEISLKVLIQKCLEWYRYLLSKWVILIIAAVIGGGIGFAYAYFKDPLYTAELTFVLEGGKQGSGLSNYSGLANQLGFDVGSGGGVFEGQNLLALMKSRLMIEKTLLTSVNVGGKKQTLAEFYIDIKKMREKWIKESSPLRNTKFLPGADPSGFSLEQNSLISSFHGALVGNNLFLDSKDKKSSILSMRVISENELFSKYFTEALAKEVSDFYVDTKVKKSLKNLTSLQNQIDSVRGKFNTDISRIAFSTDANPNPNPARQALQIPNQRRQVDVQANQAMLIALMQNLAMSQNSLREETPLIQVIDKPILPLDETSPDKFSYLLLGSILCVFIISAYFITARLLNNL